MAISIAKIGVVEPIIVRPKGDAYEMISGHRRKRATELAEKQEIPCVIRKMTDEEAVILMVDSNIQREKILPSEKAFSYKLKLEAMNRQGERTDLTSSPMAKKLKGKLTAELIGEQYGDSKDTVYRYIRLTELIPELLQMVDDEQIGFRPAVEISYLNTKHQHELLDAIQFSDATPSHDQAIRLKRLSDRNELTTDKIEKIMSEEKPNQIEKLKIKYTQLKEVLPKSVSTEDQIIKFIFQCIEEHNKRQRRKDYVR